MISYAVLVMLFLTAAVATEDQPCKSVCLLYLYSRIHFFTKAVALLRMMYIRNTSLVFARRTREDRRL